MPAIIAYRNLVDAGTVSIGVGSSIAGYPIANCQVRQLSTIAKIKRSVSSPYARLDVDLGAIKTVNFIGIIGCNYLEGGFTGSWPADFRVTSSTDGISYGSGTLSKTSLQNDLVKFSIPRNAMHYFATPVVARYFRIDLSWPGSLFDEYHFGRLWIGDSIVFPDGILAEFDMDITDTGTVETSFGQQAYEQRNTRVRVLRCSFPPKNLDSNLAYGYDNVSEGASDVPSLQGLQLEAGLTGEVIVIPRTSDTIWMQRLGIYGRIDPSGRPTIKHIAGGYYSAGVTVIEER